MRTSEGQEAGTSGWSFEVGLGVLQVLTIIQD